MLKLQIVRGANLRQDSDVKKSSLRRVEIEANRYLRTCCELKSFWMQRRDFEDFFIKTVFNEVTLPCLALPPSSKLTLKPRDTQKN